MKKYLSYIIIILAIALVCVFNSVSNSTKDKEVNHSGHSHGTEGKKVLDATLVFNKVMVVETTKGTIEIAVLQKDIPNCSKRMLSLAGKNKFKDIAVKSAKDWNVQFDEVDGNMKPLERETANNLQSCRCAVGLAHRKSPDSGTNSFFIIRETSPSVVNGYTIFGYVVKGIGVVDELTEEDSITATSVRSKTKADEKAVADVFKQGTQDLGIFSRFEMKNHAEKEAHMMEEMDKALPGEIEQPTQPQLPSDPQLPTDTNL